MAKLVLLDCELFVEYLFIFYFIDYQLFIRFYSMFLILPLLPR
jgi:hypothetical protein